MSYKLGITLLESKRVEQAINKRRNNVSIRKNNKQGVSALMK